MPVCSTFNNGKKDGLHLLEHLKGTLRWNGEIATQFTIVTDNLSAT